MANGLVKRADGWAGKRIEASIARHHRRRLERAGRIDQLEPPRGPSLWAAADPPPRAGGALELATYALGDDARPGLLSRLLKQLNSPLAHPRRAALSSHFRHRPTITATARPPNAPDPPRRSEPLPELATICRSFVSMRRVIQVRLDRRLCAPQAARDLRDRQVLLVAIVAGELRGAAAFTNTSLNSHLLGLRFLAPGIGETAANSTGRAGQPRGRRKGESRADSSRRHSCCSAEQNSASERRVLLPLVRSSRQLEAGSQFSSGQIVCDELASTGRVGGRAIGEERVGCSDQRGTCFAGNVELEFVVGPVSLRSKFNG